MLLNGTDKKPWTSSDKQRLIALILKRVRQESMFVEKSEYTLETMKRVLEEEL